MFDIFYIGKKPEVTANVKMAVSTDDAIKQCKTRYCWILHYLCDYSTFDLLWEPTPWESDQTHAFASQWQTDSGTYLIPKNGSDEINYHSDIIMRKNITSVYIIDHGNDNNVEEQLMKKGLSIKKRSRFISSYHGTLKRILSNETDEYVWICNSVCDYSNFDFSWHPNMWQKEMLHVFPSNEQKFGDTFLIHVPTFNEKIKTTELLEWYDTLHFVSDIIVPRLKIPIVDVSDESIVKDVLEHTFTSPLVLFTNKEIEDIPTVNLWREKTRTVVPLSSGANSTIVSRDAKNHIKTQLYDYPYIDKTHRQDIIDEPIDIIFISNGESNAEEHWQHLLKVTENVPNRVVRIDGVKGRAEAYKAASDASNTAWAFNVFAKLKVNPEFDWSWQPDRMQESKHYIFNAKNPITGLEYGHMGMIAYNKKLVLENKPTGLDFTLDQEHEVVPLLSGTAYYADSIDTAWRSAFREVIKLKDDKSGDLETEYRLSKWLSSSDDNLGIWSQRGAEDGIEYYDSVNGDFEKLKLSYEWSWLDDYFKQKYEKEHVL